MLLAGIFPYQLAQFDVRKYAWTYFSIFSLSYIVIFTSYNLTILHGFMIKVSIVKTILSAAMCLIVLIITYVKRKDLMYFIEMTENNFYTYSDEANFKYKFSISSMSEKITVYSAGLFFIGIYSSAVLSHPIYLAFNKNLLKSGSKMLIFTWVPFKGDTVTSFYMAHTMLFVVTIPVVMSIVGNVSLTLEIQMEFQNQFERLTYALNSILHRIDLEMPKKRLENMQILTVGDRIIYKTTSSDITPFSEEVSKRFEEKLIECVKHYKKIFE